jgi:putative phosphoribosyl transferase
VPAGAAGVTVFAHGSGSSRHSPRNRRVAARLQEAGLATLLADLLTPGEEALDQRTRELRFDIELLARRLAAATAWVSAEPSLQDLPVGYFGASTGAAAALVAAADEPDSVGAVVSRGGRPDLAGDRLADIAAPTLLIVGGADTAVLELNRRAAARMRGEVAIEVVPGATHLFEEPGALDVVADLAARWLTHHLAPGPDHGGGADR